MPNRNDEYWKELMGEDFKVQDLDAPIKPAPPKKPAPAKAPSPEKPAPAPKPPEAAPASPPAAPPREAPEAASAKPPEAPPRRAPEGLSDPATGVGFTIEYVNRQGQTVPSPKAGTPDLEAPEPQAQAPAQPADAPVQEPTRVLGSRAAPSGPAQDAPETPDEDDIPWFAAGGPPKAAPESSARRTPASPPPSGRAPRKKSPEDKFEVEFDFDSEYADVDEKPVRRGRTRRTGCLSGILMFLFIICVSVVLASLGWLWATDVLGLDGDNQLVEVTLPSDIFHTEERESEDDEGNPVTETVNVADIDKVAEELYNKGLIRYKWLFKLYSRFSNAETKVHAGTYTLNMNYDYRAIVHGMNPSTGARNEIWVTVPEGYSITQIVDLIEQKNVCDKESMLDALANYDFDYDFLDSATLGDPKRLEGYLFPDSYIFYEHDDAPNVIAKFLDNFEVKWEEEFDEKAQALGMSQRDILTVASMIEKEAGADTERDTIASVIYNRLADESGEHGTNRYLQIDATIYYIIADTGEDFSTEIDSPYNTYKYPGLPAGPIANPGIASIRAALEPRESNYYYYALGKNGLHQFFQTYEGFYNFVNSDQYGG